MVTMLHQIEKAVYRETYRRYCQELCLPIYEVGYHVPLGVGLYYWQFGDKTDKFGWDILNKKSELQLEQSLYPLTRHRVKKLIKSMLYLPADNISFATYLYLLHRFDIDLFLELNVPYKITKLIEEYIGQQDD